MVRLRLALSLLASVVLVVVTTATRSQGGSREDWRSDFRRGMESLDYERFREAALAFAVLADGGPPEGSQPDLQLYGQRWVPYLPHFLLGTALFEIGRYDAALAEWSASTGELATLDGPRRRSGLETYKRRASRRGRYTARFVEEILPTTIHGAERAVARARQAWSKASNDLERLDLAGLAGFEEPLGRLGDEIGALSSELERLGTEETAVLRADMTESPGDFLPVVHRRSRAASIAQRAGGLSEEVETVLAAVDRWLLEQLEISPDRLRRSPRRPPFAPAAAGDALHGTPSCGYPADPEERLEQVLSDFLIGDAVTRVRGCDEIRAIAAPRLRCAVSAMDEIGRLPEELRVAHGATLGRFAPRLALARAAARCGQRETARALLPPAGEDGDGDRRSIERWIAATEQSAFPGRSHALLIGAWDYADWPALPGVRDDLESVRREVEAQGFETTVLENPTEARLREAMARLPGRLREEDRLLVYYAGHGHVTEDPSRDVSVGWIVPVDAPRAGPSELPTAAVSMDQMRSWALRDLGFVRAQLFVLDTCFSGRIFLPGDASAAVCGSPSPPGERLREEFPFLVPGASSARAVERMESLTARVLVSAGSSGQRVPDASRFRQEWVAAVGGGEREADRDGDGYLMSDAELGPFLARRLRRTGGPVPQHASLCPGGDFVFRLPWVDALAAEGPGGVCDGDALAVLRDVYRWEALREAGLPEAYLSASECRLFEDLAREMVARRPPAPRGLDG